jgi:hypothetical protein
LSVGEASGANPPAGQRGAHQSAQAFRQAIDQRECAEGHPGSQRILAVNDNAGKLIERAINKLG